MLDDASIEVGQIRVLNSAQTLMGKEPVDFEVLKIGQQRFRERNDVPL